MAASSETGGVLERDDAVEEAAIVDFSGLLAADKPRIDGFGATVAAEVPLTAAAEAGRDGSEGAGAAAAEGPSRLLAAAFAASIIGITVLREAGLSELAWSIICW